MYPRTEQLQLTAGQATVSLHNKAFFQTKSSNEPEIVILSLEIIVGIQNMDEVCKQSESGTGKPGLIQT